MARMLQLQIPAPCSEDWENMRPEEKGRFCGACSKTVVDFSMMSDREIIAYLSRAGQRVCGRIAADQLNRGIALQPDAARARQRWWKWLLAGLMVSSEVKAQRLPTKPAMVKVALPGRSNVLIGDTVVTTKDTIKVQELPAVEVKGYPAMRIRMGAVVCGTRVETATLWAKDTLSALGLLPKKEWNVYPNPSRRGSAVMLAWHTVDAGTYDVGLFDARGNLVLQRVLQVSSKGQIDLLDIPGSLAPGTYFLRCRPPGKGKADTRTLVVL